MASLCLVSVYYTSLCMFAFISHPIVYCFLLLVNVGSVSGFLYLCFGFSWYIVLFCLVYVGGVYVLFIFISVFIPNTSPQSGESLFLFLILLFFFFFLTGWAMGFNSSLFFEGSQYICSLYEGVSYCFFCLVLLVGFMILSAVVSEKGSFFR